MNTSEQVSQAHSGTRGLLNRLSEGYEYIIALVLLTLQPLIFYRGVLFAPDQHIPFDIGAFHLPLASYIARSVRQGVFPFWDPYPYCGVPIHADITAQLFYPFTWIALFLGNLSDGHNLFYWLEWLVPFHMILAGWFTYWLLREFGLGIPAALFGGTVYQLSGFFASQAQHLGAICSAAWLPLILLSIFKLSIQINARWISILALSIALNILAGFPAATAVALGAGALVAICPFILRPYWFFGKAGAKFAAALISGFALGVGMAAVQLIPTYLLSRLSVASLRSQLPIADGLHLESLVSLVSPNYFHIFTPFDPSLYTLPINFTFLYVYCGWIALLLIVITPLLRNASDARVLFLFTVFSVFWMLGDNTPVYSFIFGHLPSLIRGALYPEFALLAFSMFAALTAAVALQRAFGPSPKRWLWIFPLLAAADLIYFGSGRPMNSAPGSYKEMNSEYDIGGSVGSLAQIRRLTGNTNPPARIDYLDAGEWTYTTGAELLALPTSDGNNPFMLKRMYALRRIFGGGNYWDRDLPAKQLDSPLIRAMNTEFLAGQFPAAIAALKQSGLQHEVDTAGLSFYRVPDALPRFFFVQRLHLTHSPDEAFAYLANPAFKPSEEAVVEVGNKEDDLRSSEPLGSGEVSVISYSANRIALSVTTIARGYLATSEPFYPGWTATVNGKTAPLYMTNGAFRGLILEKGSNQIVMSYWPQGFLPCILISIMSLLLVTAGLIFGNTNQTAYVNPKVIA